MLLADEIKIPDCRLYKSHALEGVSVGSSGSSGHVSFKKILDNAVFGRRRRICTDCCSIFYTSLLLPPVAAGMESAGMVLILRGTIVNRTYDTHKNLHNYLFY